MLREAYQPVFLASDTKAQREFRVRQYPRSDPGITLLLAAVNFEWTVSRAVLFLSHSPNSALRARIRECSGLDKYKVLWKDEVVAALQCRPLPNVVSNWSSVREAFNERHKLVHGRDRVNWKVAKPHIDSLLKGTGYVEDYCCSLGFRFQDRMPIRRKRR
jgi:hypothetical protein